MLYDWPACSGGRRGKFCHVTHLKTILRQNSGWQVGLIAMQCTRALLTSANRGNTALQYGVSQLMPELIQFLASAAEAAENTNSDDPMVSTTDEVIKILVSFVTSFDEESSQFRQ